MQLVAAHADPDAKSHDCVAVSFGQPLGGADTDALGESDAEFDLTLKRKSVYWEPIPIL